MTVRRKGGKRQLAPLAPRTVAAIEAMLAGRGTGPLFPTRRGSRMDRHAAQKIVRRLARQAGVLKVVSPHSLRHSFVTAALDVGVPLRTFRTPPGTPTRVRPAGTTAGDTLWTGTRRMLSRLPSPSRGAYNGTRRRAAGGGAGVAVTTWSTGATRPDDAQPEACTGRRGG